MSWLLRLGRPLNPESGKQGFYIIVQLSRGRIADDAADLNSRNPSGERLVGSIPPGYPSPKPSEGSECVYSPFIFSSRFFTVVMIKVMIRQGFHDFQTARVQYSVWRRRGHSYPMENKSLFGGERAGEGCGVQQLYNLFHRGEKWTMELGGGGLLEPQPLPWAVFPRQRLWQGWMFSTSPVTNGPYDAKS
jgi:hypothetical protein